MTQRIRRTTICSACKRRYVSVYYRTDYTLTPMPDMPASCECGDNMWHAISTAEIETWLDAKWWQFWLWKSGGRWVLDAPH